MKVKEILALVVEVLQEMLEVVGYFIQNNLYNFSLLLNITTPYLCLWLGADTFKDRGYFAVGGEYFVPVMMFAIIIFLQRTANKIGKGVALPRARRRFTQVNDDGEVLVDNARLEELLLYMADLEDWMEKEGVAPWKNK